MPRVLCCMQQAGSPLCSMHQAGSVQSSPIMHLHLSTDDVEVIHFCYSLIFSSLSYQRIRKFSQMEIGIGYWDITWKDFTNNWLQNQLWIYTALEGSNLWQDNSRSSPWDLYIKQHMTTPYNCVWTMYSHYIPTLLSLKVSGICREQTNLEVCSFLWIVWRMGSRITASVCIRIISTVVTDLRGCF